MKSIVLSIAVLLSLSFSHISAAPAHDGDSIKNERPARKKNRQKEPVKLDVSAELAVLEAQLGHEAQVAAQKAQQLRSSLRYNTSVKVFDLAGNLLHESAKGQQPQVPTNADLLFVQGDTEYYIVMQ
jgi:hypothetical protein